MITKNLKPAVNSEIDELFEKVKMRLLGPLFVAAAYHYLVKDYDPKSTLGALFIHALSQNTIKADSTNFELIDTVSQNAAKLIDSLKERTKNDMNSAIDSVNHDINVKSRLKAMTADEYLDSPEGRKIKDALAENIKKSFKNAEIGISRIAETEGHNAQSLGALEGIVNMATMSGITDPLIFKRGVMDEKRCFNCWTMCNLPGHSPIPKVYKMSEIKSGYFDRKNPQMVVGGLHPGCRDLIMSIPLKYGFDESGTMVYRGYFQDNTPWNEWEHQRTGKI